MSDENENAQKFLKKSIQSEHPIKEGFEVKKPLTIGIPLTIELTEEEKRQIQKLLMDEYHSRTVPEESVVQHVKQLMDITKQVKSISAQSILLHGERIKQAKDILKDYREGAFTKWLLTTYGNRQTPYSMLNYYELYHNAPVSHKAIIESAPKKAVYLLASRDGDLDKKMELLQEHGKSPQADLMLRIQEIFPIAEHDQRQPKNSSAIEAIAKACQKLEKNSHHLNKDDLDNIKDLIERLQNLCKA